MTPWRRVTIWTAVFLFVKSWVYWHRIYNEHWIELWCITLNTSLASYYNYVASTWYSYSILHDFMVAHMWKCHTNMWYSYTLLNKNAKIIIFLSLIWIRFSPLISTLPAIELRSPKLELASYILCNHKATMQVLGFLFL